MHRLIILLFILNSVGSTAQGWKFYIDTARVYSGQKNNSKTVEYLLRAYEEGKKDSTDSAYQRLNNEIGDVYVAMGQYAKAAPFYEFAIRIIEKKLGNNSAEYATSANNLGRVYRLMGAYAQAEPLLLNAKEIRQNLFGKNNADYAMSCNNLAVLYYEVGQLDVAGPLYLEAKEVREKVLGKEHIDYATSCNNLAIYYMTIGKLYEAEPLYVEAKNIREKVLGKEHPFYAASLNNLGALYKQLGQYRKAEPLYLEAKNVRGNVLGKEHPEYAASCNNLAVLYMETGRYEQAEPLYFESREIVKKILGTEHPDYARGNNNLALLYRTLGQFDKAEELFIEARRILGATAGKEHPEYATSCNNLGALYMETGKYEKADSLYGEARTVWLKVLGNEHPEYAKSLHNLALIRFLTEDYNKAEDLFLQSNTIRAKNPGKDHPDFANSCDNLAVLYTTIGQYEKALALYSESRKIREKVFGNEHPDYLESTINLANLYRVMGDMDKATLLNAEAFNTQQALVKNIFNFTTEPEKLAYVKKINEYRTYFLSQSFSTGENGGSYSYAVTLAHRNLILQSTRQLRQAIINSNDSSLTERYVQWVAAKEELAFWYVKPVQDRKGELKAISERATRLEKELVASSESFRKEMEKTEWQQVRQALGTAEAAIEFSSFQYHTGKRLTDSIYYVALVTTINKPAPVLVPLFEKRQLDSLLTYKTTSPGLHQLTYLYSTTTSANSLYKLVWKPIEKYLQGIKTVFFAPAGHLHKISFAAIRINSDESLSDRYDLVQLSTTASILTKKNTALERTDKVFLYGGVQYDADSSSIRKAILKQPGNDIASRTLPAELTREGITEFYELPGTMREINAISGLANQNKFGISIANGITATEESFKALNGEQSPAVLHLATHGFFFPDPIQTKTFATTGGAPVLRQSDDPLIRSGLALAGANNAWKGKPVIGIEDGILTSYEVSNMYLPNTRLAVLSACETGLGDIHGSEGVYGLQRAFKMTGVENLVMSLWKVPDNETAEFMQEFYRNLFSGQSIYDSFSRSQKAMKNKYRNDPYKWAAWVLVR